MLYCDISVFPDINECDSADTNLCEDKTSCVNTDGNFLCSCAEGSRLDNDGRACVGKSVNFSLK